MTYLELVHNTSLKRGENLFLERGHIKSTLSRVQKSTLLRKKKYYLGMRISTTADLLLISLKRAICASDMID